MTDQPTIFFVDDDPKAGELFRRFCSAVDIRVKPFQNPVTALDAFAKTPCDLLISDLKMPEMTGIEVLAAVRKQDPDIPVILITGFSTVDNAIEALRLGASDFIKKPYDPEELVHQVQLLLNNLHLKQENRQLKAALTGSDQPSLIGDSKVMLELKSMIKKLAEIRCNVIIYGASGTGKELVARDLHHLGSYKDEPFIVIDCGALTDTLLESELFGHEKGAFTGADRKRIGRLESASGGTVFLDEISNISDAMQTKLLRVVQEQQVTPVGSAAIIDINVRFIVATNQNLEELVAAGKFRHDLYHRLNVVQINVPSLKQRVEDIPLLTHHFIKHFNLLYQLKVQAFSQSAIEQLMHYDWPGNVRELRNLVERHMVLNESEQLELLMPPKSHSQNSDSIDSDQPNLTTLEERYIKKTLKNSQGNRKEAAATLGINATTLWRKLQNYQD